jgi:hypothetical protein
MGGRFFCSKSQELYSINIQPIDFVLPVIDISRVDPSALKAIANKVAIAITTPQFIFSERAYDRNNPKNNKKATQPTPAVRMRVVEFTSGLIKLLTIRRKAKVMVIFLIPLFIKYKHIGDSKES